MWHRGERRATHVNREGKETPSRPGCRWYDWIINGVGQPGLC